MSIDKKKTFCTGILKSNKSEMIITQSLSSFADRIVNRQAFNWLKATYRILRFQMISQAAIKKKNYHSGCGKGNGGI